jgi:hypothetical protein
MGAVLAPSTSRVIVSPGAVSAGGGHSYPAG